MRLCVHASAPPPLISDAAQIHFHSKKQCHQVHQIMHLSASLVQQGVTQCCIPSIPVRVGPLRQGSMIWSNPRNPGFEEAIVQFFRTTCQAPTQNPPNVCIWKPEKCFHSGTEANHWTHSFGILKNRIFISRRKTKWFLLQVTKNMRKRGQYVSVRNTAANLFSGFAKSCRKGRNINQGNLFFLQLQ